MDGVRRLLLDEPENRNALSLTLIASLREGLAAAIADEAVRVVVIDHEGPVFCAGADLRSAGSHADAQPYIDLLRELWWCPKPVVCVVRGAVRGGGMGLVAASDILVAGEQATFGFPEVRVGAAPAMVAAVVLQRIGRGAALELFLTGEPIGPHRARELGLVTAVGDDPAPYLEALRRGGPEALAAVKRIVNERPGLEDLERLGAVTTAMLAGEEAREGIAAFFEKRPPSWSA